jgi:hypothetical protein
MDGFAAAWMLAGEAVRALIVPPGSGISVMFLAWIFAWSGGAKIWHPDRAAVAMVNFGVVRRILAWQGRALGVAEVTLSMVLILLPSLGVRLAALLLAVFVLLIARSLLRGVSFPCACFGAGDERISVWTLARAVVLASLASALTFGSTPSPAARGLVQVSLEAIVAGSLLGMIALTAFVPALLGWNRDPLGQLGQRHREEAHA